jgi:DNA-binding CsgD family transcriptional regulator
MSVESKEQLFIQITAARARVLRELADGWKEREVAAHLGVTYNGVRSLVRELKAITGCSGVHELGRWWRAHREEWARFVTEAGGADGRAV